MERLTAKEESIMEMIWQIGSCTPKDVLAMMPEPRPHINTVSTIIQLLEKKGYPTAPTAGATSTYPQ